MQYLHEAAQERAREQAIAPDMDDLRWEGMRIVFVELPCGLARAAFVLFGHVLLALVFCVFIPFLVLFPETRRGGTRFLGEMRESAKNEVVRHKQFVARLNNFQHRWRQRKEKIQNG
jgi:hypothetical protein